MTLASAALSRPARPKISERSTVSTEMPARSKSFSLKRTVMKFAGRAPIRPTRASRSPRVTRHVLTNLRRSARKLALFGSTVCRAVSEYLMPYWCRLLQTDILPQNESRRSAGVMWAASSEKAWTSTGTSRPDQRMVLAMARSSPKFGRVTRMPSISSRCALNRSAHFWASATLSTLP